MYTFIYQHSHGCEYATLVLQTTINTQEHSTAKDFPLFSYLLVQSYSIYTDAAVAVATPTQWVLVYHYLAMLSLSPTDSPPVAPVH